jgi:hypothetical protein
MRVNKFALGLVAAAALCAAPFQAFGAGFNLFDNFDSYITGPLSGQGGWTTSTTTGAHTDVVAATLPDKEVQVFGNSIPNSKPLGALSIPNASSVATVYFNFKMAAAPSGNNFNFIVTDVTTPADTAGTSEVQFNYDAGQTAPAGGVTNFRIRDGGNFRYTSLDTTTANEIPTVANALYNVWFVINNSADNYQVYIQSNDIPALSGTPHQVFGLDGTTGVSTGGTFGFRNGAAANDLITVNMGNGAAGNAVNFDDIYVDNTSATPNLTNPVPEPAAIGMLALAGFGLLARRRK